MKNNEIIQFAALFALAAALLYRKYGKRNKPKEGTGKIGTGKSLLSSGSADDNYEPYSKNNSKEK
jgi:hypothetical protein